jgi:hypothetical protein
MLVLSSINSSTSLRRTSSLLNRKKHTCNKIYANRNLKMNMLNRTLQLGKAPDRSHHTAETMLLVIRAPRNTERRRTRLKMRTDSQVALSTTKTSTTANLCTLQVLPEQWPKMFNNLISNLLETMFPPNKWCLMKTKSLRPSREKTISKATRLSLRSQTRGNNSSERLCFIPANKIRCSQVAKCERQKWLYLQTTN